jgi:hypothetical protein
MTLKAEVLLMTQQNALAVAKEETFLSSIKRASEELPRWQDFLPFHTR